MYQVVFSFDFGAKKKEKCKNVKEVEKKIKWIDEQIKNGNYKNSHHEVETLPDEVNNEKVS